MSATNHTTNYNLPQFVGTDKPGWLSDINSAFGAIDSQMKTNADNVTIANTTANTADGKADTAQTTANNAVSAIADLVAKFNINDFTSQTVDQFDFAISSDQGTLYLAQSEDGSVFKFYGNIVLDNPQGTNRNIANTAIPMGVTPGTLYGIKTSLQLQSIPTGAYAIQCAVLRNRAPRTGDPRAVYDMWNSSIAVGADGYIYICVGESSGNVTIAPNSILRLTAFPCTYFNSNFGDTPEE